MTIEVRAALVDDAARIARIHIASWRATYAGVLSPERLAGLSVHRRTESWRRIIDGGGSIHVASVDDVVVGFASAGPARGEEPPRELELYAIYQLPEAHGTGTGQALLDASLGRSPAFLWVADPNPRAQAFYRRNGFESDGEQTVLSDLDSLTEIRMLR
jgi:ribosomal protein S18 acetylase RimI-like enzyme